MWTDARAEFDWADMDRYIAHQVSQVHTAAMCRTIGIDSDRVPRSFPLRGNMGPASIPFTLATQVDSLQTGDRVLLMGVGSGLNGVLHRAGVVTAPRRRSPRAGLPGLDPGLVAAGHRRPRAHVARARPRAAPAHGTLRVRPRQPDVVVPVAAVRRGARRRAGGWWPSTSSAWASRSGARPRTLADRVDDLDAVLAALDVTGPVVTAGHDWGGAVVAGLGGASPRPAPRRSCWPTRRCTSRPVPPRRR